MPSCCPCTSKRAGEHAHVHWACLHGVYGHACLQYLLGRCCTLRCPQKFALGQYDILFATNVLHATRSMPDTLQNCKALLRKGGLLLANELTAKTDFLTLTFGLTDGWWLHSDIGIRIGGSPLISRRASAALALPASFTCTVWYLAVCLTIHMVLGRLSSDMYAKFCCRTLSVHSRKVDVVGVHIKLAVVDATTGRAGAACWRARASTAWQLLAQAARRRPCWHASPWWQASAMEQ